ncbi:MAG: glycosyltransferase family 2 protein [Bacteroidetes bacterium]|nr:glycosyltransferase family 2 protein [Bacteroidota bacterium]MCL5027187.1 glycosyltransferase family 2 protein [Chloroflexota bacterium]
MHAAVIIPNWNGRHHLTACLDALRRQTHPDFETIIVDNGSTDGSQAWLRESYPEVRLVELPRNRGFSVAVNVGIRQSSGEVAVVLNNDTEAEPQWLAELCRPLAERPGVGLCASKLLLFDRRDVLHSAGDYYGVDGVPGNRGVWQRDGEQYGREEPVFGACAGAAAYRRSMLDEIGLFDEDLVAYCEDVDLNWRAQLAGYPCLFVPTARVYHKLSATGAGPFASYYCGRNFILVLAKDVPTRLLVRHWPAIFGAQLRFTAQSLAHFREPAARARLRGQIAAIKHLPAFLAKRRMVQRSRRVDVAQIEALLGQA